ncbi:MULTISPECIES: heme/hemin ABC transporter substrate-binding protein [Corynebacterium]|uniref:ABC-type hemin transport system, periplasmic component n=1 Tax=Corynebacterium singulare TaxID=161899 RepID=A0A0B6F5U2_9CORY|nr:MULTISPECIES: ABC transporter substrate-binding protein [Corynebacterium]AJI79406.1 ABC-type hemin transport system, periplasmic component [Corynebacterium singulare]MDK8763145.1 ABC transporter substrate-binding protein [Corynebacterium sp. MSK218]OFR62999.1 ABC transporter substrate-binding protein [Corynebacterium sp. HMSC078H07]
MKLLLRLLFPLLCIVGLTACGVQGSYTDQLPDPQDLSDPRSFEGVTEVSDFADIEPVSTKVQPALPVELTDADGYDVSVTDVSRILALDIYGTYTKTLSGLGLADNIVGRTVSSTEPNLADRPVVTEGGHNINVEAVLELNPTLVIVDHSIGPRDAIDQIREAGVTTVVMEPQRTIDSVDEDIITLGETVGLPDEARKLSERSIKEIDESKEAIKTIAPEEPMRMAFLYARGNGGVFFIMGEGTGAQDLIEGIGGVDLAAENNLSYAEPANAEALARINPEVIIMMTDGLKSTGGVDGLLERPGVAQTIAGQKQRIVTIPDGQSLAFGPMTGQTLVKLAKAVYDPDNA